MIKMTYLFIYINVTILLYLTIFSRVFIFYVQQKDGGRLREQLPIFLFFLRFQN